MIVTKKKIKEYWTNRLPQRWYSKKDYGTEEYWDEVSKKRYSIYYSYLPTIAEFNDHKGEKLLEIGVGVGTDALEYGKGGANVTGIDLTETAIEITKNRFKQKNLKGIFKTDDAENLSFSDNMFDIVYCFGILHHTPNTKKSINEIRRVLKPGGKAIIMLYAKGWKHYCIRLFYNGLLKGQLFKMSKQEVINKNSEVEGNSPLTKVYSRKEIEELFGKKWQHIDIKRYRMGAFFEYSHYGRPMLPKPIRWLSCKLKLERLFGENWIIKVIK